MKNYEYNPADHKFETLAEFKIYLSCGANVAFDITMLNMELKLYSVQMEKNKMTVIAYGMIKKI